MNQGHEAPTETNAGSASGGRRGGPGPDAAIKGSADAGASPGLCNCLLNMMHC